MSYIFIDFDEGRRCAALISAEAEKLAALTGGAPSGRRAELEAFRQKLSALAADLSEETEKLASIDDRMKTQHLLTVEEARAKNGKE